MRCVLIRFQRLSGCIHLTGDGGDPAPYQSRWSAPDEYIVGCDCMDGMRVREKFHHARIVHLTDVCPFVRQLVVGHDPLRGPDACLGRRRVFYGGHQLIGMLNAQDGDAVSAASAR